MKTLFFRLLSPLLLLALTVSCTNNDQLLLLQSDVDRLQNRVEQIESGSIRKARSQLQDLEQSQQNQTGALEQSLTRISNMERTLNSLARQQETLQDRMSQIEKNQLALNQEIKQSAAESRNAAKVAIDQARKEFNEAQNQLSKAVDKRIQNLESSLSSRISKLDKDINSLYRDIESTLNSYSSGSYIVQPGDTLSVIAQQLGIGVDELARLNGIEDPSKIRVGQELKIP